MTATERDVGMGPTKKGEDNVSWKQKVADVIEGEDAEYDIKHGTDGTKSEQIEEGVRGLKAADSVVDSCYPDDDDCPDGSDEKAEGKRQGEGVE